MKPKYIILLSVGIIFAVVLIQNTQVVSLQILFWKISMSRIIFLPLIMLIGFMVGFFVGRKSWDW
ncbi:MAG: LapA family protein [Candidatus Omnitrophica bacterium]|nr:LapA family protein [Candidatus Omnitrophota bacterium]MBU1995697.1 LapA family protein [Candidatus Omnitrophota bacterium]MBU4333294.1 LapA family protein [Candidatus Omnitrophota bacterium]